MTDAEEMEVADITLADVVQYVRELQAHTERTGQDHSAELTAALALAGKAPMVSAQDVAAALFLMDLMAESGLIVLSAGGIGLNGDDCRLIRRLAMEVARITFQPSMGAIEANTATFH